MSLFPSPKDSVFWFDFEGLTDDNKFRDLGPYGLHATPQAGFTAPNYGLARNAHGKGYVNLTGAANVHATLPLRFYQYAPTTAWTWVVGARWSDAAVDQTVFSCLAAPGFGLRLYFPVANRLGSDAYNAAFASMGGSDWAALQYAPRTRVHVHSFLATSFYYQWTDRVQATPNLAFAAAGPVSYNVATVPLIGASPVGDPSAVCQLSHLALFPFPFVHSEALATSDWLRDRT